MASFTLHLSPGDQVNRIDIPRPAPLSSVDVGDITVLVSRGTVDQARQMGRALLAAAEFVENEIRLEAEEQKAREA